METALLHRLVTPHLASTLPVKQLHDPAAFADKDGDLSIGRVPTHTAGLAAHPVESDTHIHRMPGHYDTIVLVQIKHDIFDYKVQEQ